MSPVALAAKPPAAACRQAAAIRGRDARRPVPSRPLQVARAAADDDKVAAVQQALEQAKANPETADKLKLMEEAMANPAMQAQLGGMMEVMQNPAFMARMADLKEDPELKPIFEEIKGGGMPALMKYMNDPEFLGKIGAKMGDVAPAGVPTTAAAAAAAPPQEVNNILDAAKYGDLEAIEDYMAIGKGDLKDGEGRTALHYAVAYDQAPAVQALLSSGFDSNATEKDGNTALHYAAGYGRKECVGMLLAAGADVGVKNGKGQTAVDVVKGEPRNPLNQDTTLLAVLDGTAEPATINQ